MYAYEVLRELATQHKTCEFVVFCGPEAAESFRARKLGANVKIKRLPLPSRIKPLRLLQELCLLPFYALAARVDLLHSLGNTSPLWGGKRRVVTVHDVIFHHFPNTFPRAAQKGLEVIVPLSCRRADRVIAISQATKDDLVEIYGIPEAKIEMIHNGFGMSEPARPTPAAALTERLGIGERPVVLTIAAALEHKNLDRLFEAVALLKEQGLVIDLVMAGHRGLEFDRLIALGEQLGVADQLHLTGWVSDEDLSGLYRLADCFVYPSLFEGFGAPVLETMNRGVPLATSTGGAIKELVGDAALTFDPTDVSAIADAIRRLIEDKALAAELAERGRERAPGFSWEKTARGYWETYEKVTAS